jgi:hypothetical protein
MYSDGDDNDRSEAEIHKELPKIEMNRTIATRT